MNPRASGRFEVTATREPPWHDADGVVLARTRLYKRFHGDLDATSTVEMPSAMNTAVPGSAGYVAIERVEGTLHDRRGSFVLQHNGTMENGDGRLSCTVVPGTGLGELTGLAGSLTIRIADGEHFYAFDYALAGAPATAG